MQLTSSLALLALATSSLAERSRCGAHEPHDALVKEHEAQEMEDRKTDIASGYSRESTTGSIEVTTYAHIVTTKEHAMSYTFEQVNDQLAVLNDAYNRYGISFNHVNTSYSVNNAWGTVSESTDTELRMKRALRRGGYGKLRRRQ